MHFATVNHIGAYLTGLALGYVIVKKLEVKSTWFYLVGWAVCFVLMQLIMNMGVWLASGDVTRVQEIATGVAVRFIALAAFSWLVYALWAHRAPLLGPLFESKWLVPLGRIAYPTFMMHYLVIWYDNFTLRDPIEYNTSNLVSD